MDFLMTEIIDKLPHNSGRDSSVLCEAVLLYTENAQDFVKSLPSNPVYLKAYFYILVRNYKSRRSTIKISLEQLLSENILINFNEYTTPLVTITAMIELEKNLQPTASFIYDYVEDFFEQDFTHLSVFEETAHTITIIKSLLQVLICKKAIIDIVPFVKQLCSLLHSSPSLKIYHETIQLIKVVLTNTEFCQEIGDGRILPELFLKELHELYLNDRLLMALCDLNEYLFKHKNLSDRMRYWCMLRNFAIDPENEESDLNFKRRFYILRKHIDAIIDANISLTKETDGFYWDPEKKTELETAWDAFFTIVDNLTGNHRHLIIPSFGLLTKVKCLGEFWVSLLIRRGLENDSKNVRYACVRYLLDNHVMIKFGNDIRFTKVLNDTGLFDGKQMDLKKFEHFVKKNPNSIKLKDLQKSIPIYYTSLALLEHLKDIIPKENTVQAFLQGQNRYKITSVFNSILRSLKMCQNTEIRDLISVECIHIFIDFKLYIWADRLKNLEYFPYLCQETPVIDYSTWCKIRDCTLPFNFKKKFITKLTPPTCQNKLDELYYTSNNNNKLDQLIISVLEDQSINSEYSKKLFDVINEVLVDIQETGTQLKIDKEYIKRLIVVIQQNNNALQRKLLAIKLFATSENKYKSSKNCLFTSLDKILNSIQSSSENENHDTVMYFIDAISEFRSKKLKFAAPVTYYTAHNIVALSLELISRGSINTLKTELILVKNLLANMESEVLDLCDMILPLVVSEKKDKSFESLVTAFLSLTEHVMPCTKVYEYMAKNYYKPLFDLCPSLIAKFLDGNLIKLHNMAHVVEILLTLDIDLMLVDQIQKPDEIIECGVTGSDTYPYIYTFLFPTCFDAIPADLLISRYYEISKKQTRYFADSQTHRTKLRIVQYLAILSVHKKSQCQNYISKKLFNALFKENNQLNVTYLLELIVANAEQKDFEELLEAHFYQNLQPAALQSLFVVYFYRCQMHHYDKELREKCVEIMLPHTMGQHFATRLYAQVIVQRLITNMPNRYQIIADTINRFQATQPDKNYKRVMEDFRWNILEPPNYNISYFLTSRNVFYEIPRVTQMSLDFYKGVVFMENESTLADVKPITIPKKADIQELNPSIDNVQVKIIPRKQLDFNIEDLDDFPPQQIERKQSTQSELIIVASLLKKLPNLGGLARTCEIFNVKLYVISSVKHLDNREFQGLSVTAEKWLNIAEVQPWQVGDYLINMKEQGYVVIGAEQTANSKQITKFNFPKKCILLLGEEREGIPANLISLLDHAVEVPQLGVTRSLNVHVCASLFVWEYAKQHQLPSIQS